MSDNMNKRKFSRKKRKKISTKSNPMLTKDFFLNEIEHTINNAIEGEACLSCDGNFLFLSTPSGEGWLLDPKTNYAIRLVDNFEPQEFIIEGSKNGLTIEWKEQFQIKDNAFISIKDGKLSLFHDYPIQEIKMAMEFLDFDEAD